MPSQSFFFDIANLICSLSEKVGVFSIIVKYMMKRWTWFTMSTFDLYSFLNAYTIIDRSRVYLAYTLQVYSAVPSRRSHVSLTVYFIPSGIGSLTLLLLLINEMSQQRVSDESLRIATQPWAKYL